MTRTKNSKTSDKPLVRAVFGLLLACGLSVGFSGCGDSDSGTGDPNPVIDETEDGTNGENEIAEAE